MKQNHVHLNHARSVTDWNENSITNFGILGETLPTPAADKQEAAHYVHDHVLGNNVAEDLL